MGDVETIEYAIRYCITRSSYAFDDGLRLAESHWDDLSHATQQDVICALRNRDRIWWPAGATNPKIAAALEAAS